MHGSLTAAYVVGLDFMPLIGNYPQGLPFCVPSQKFLLYTPGRFIIHHRHLQAKNPCRCRRVSAFFAVLPVKTASVKSKSANFLKLLLPHTRMEKRGND
jgi:hypothetical protein